MNTYAYLIKAKAKATEARSLFCWLSAKSDSRAEREILNILEDNGIEVGRGADHQLPVRTDWLVVDDLPEEGVLDDAWCERYQLAENGTSWQAILSEAPTNEAVTPTEGTQPDDVSQAPVKEELEHPVAQLSFRKKLLSQFISNDINYHVTQAQRIQISEMELDQDNYYVQNLLLAAENTPDIKGFSANNLWKLTDAVKSVFAIDSRPELGVLLQFMKAWVQTPHIDRGILIKEWVAGNRITSVAPIMKAEPSLSVVDTVRKNSFSKTIMNDAGTCAGGGTITDRQNITAHSLDVLDIEIAAALLPMDFNIYEFPGGVLRRAKEVIREKEEPWKSWSSVLRKIAGILDFSRAAIFVLIRNAPEAIHEKMPDLIGYVSKNLIEVPFVPDTGIEDSESRWNTVRKLFNSPATGEPEKPVENVHPAEGELVKVANGVFDASSLFTAPSKTETVKANQPVEVADNVQMEETHDDAVNHPTDTLYNDSGHHNEKATSEQLYTHLMVDLESMGSNPDAPIISMGAIFFDPHTGQTGAEFYKVISLESAMALGGKPDAGTILWWMKQSSEARSALLVEDAIPLDDALLQFNDFICENAANGPGTLQIWGNGATFDNVLLRQSFERAGIPCLWKFWNDRDVRTIVEMGKVVGINSRYEIPFEGDLHNALSDARHQVKYVSAIWQRLTEK